MKKKAVLSLGFVWVFALSFVFMKASQFSEVVTQIGLATVQDAQYEKEIITTISVEEQNMVENGPYQQGFVSQENGTGFYFLKVK